MFKNVYNTLNVLVILYILYVTLFQCQLFNCVSVRFYCATRGRWSDVYEKNKFQLYWSSFLEDPLHIQMEAVHSHIVLKKQINNYRAHKVHLQNIGIKLTLTKRDNMHHCNCMQFNFTESIIFVFSCLFTLKDCIK